jgi:hypothetical protein
MAHGLISRTCRWLRRQPTYLHSKLRRFLEMGDMMRRLVPRNACWSSSDLTVGSSQGRARREICQYLGNETRLLEFAHRDYHSNDWRKKSTYVPARIVQWNL